MLSASIYPKEEGREPQNLPAAQEGPSPRAKWVTSRDSAAGAWLLKRLPPGSASLSWGIGVQMWGNCPFPSPGLPRNTAFSP